MPEKFWENHHRGEISPQELKELMSSGAEVTLLDVREPEERTIASIGGIHIPLGDLANRLNEIPQDQEVIVYCHHGIRSRHAVGFLRQSGFDKTVNLSGGIDRWSFLIDPSIPRY